MVFTGNANPELAQKIVSFLGIPLGEASVSQFSDGEIAVELLVNVRGRDVFVVQPTCAPTNDNLMELIIMVDALRRASAGRITAVVPRSEEHTSELQSRGHLVCRLLLDKQNTH